jgi:hypothetical protein
MPVVDTIVEIHIPLEKPPGAAEADLLAVAARVAALSGVPSGVFAMVTDAGAKEIGAGRRVEL